MDDRRIDLEDVTPLLSLGIGAKHEPSTFEIAATTVPGNAWDLDWDI